MVPSADTFFNPSKASQTVWTCRYSSTTLSPLLFPNTETFLPSYKKDKLAISTFKCLLKLHKEMGTHNQILFFWVGLFRKFLFVVFLDMEDNFSTPGLLFQNNW